jgi:hypothetical protein
MDNFDVKNIMEISKLEEKDFKELKNFANKNLNKLKTQNSSNTNTNYINNNNQVKEKLLKANFDNSFRKEKHALLNKKKKDLCLEELNFINSIVDYSTQFGFIYKTSKDVIGIYFNDKSLIYKVLKKDEFYFQNKKNKRSINNTILYNSKKLKDVQSEIRNKLEILKNYENYLSTLKNPQNDNETKSNDNMSQVNKLNNNFL